MSLTRKDLRKMLRGKVTSLNDIVADFDNILTLLENDFFRVSIFGSARLKPESPLYKDVYQLAFNLAQRNVDIVTGGGPGLMDAANKGAKDGGITNRSIGLSIELPFEDDANDHLDIKRNHKRFSSRLDEFMRISHAVIVAPGGIGTMLELFYTWQLIQANHIQERPMILLGDGSMWEELIDWMKKWPLEKKLMSKEDFNPIHICRNIDEVVKNIEEEKAHFESRKKNNSHIFSGHLNEP